MDIRTALLSTPSYLETQNVLSYVGAQEQEVHALMPNSFAKHLASRNMQRMGEQRCMELGQEPVGPPTRYGWAMGC